MYEESMNFLARPCLPKLGAARSLLFDLPQTLQ